MIKDNVKSLQKNISNFKQGVIDKPDDTNEMPKILKMALDFYSKRNQLDKDNKAFVNVTNSQGMIKKIKKHFIPKNYKRKKPNENMNFKKQYKLEESDILFFE